MEKSVMMVAIDDSEHSYHALEWTLQHFFSPAPENSLFKVVIVHAKPSPVQAFGPAGPAAAEALLHLDSDLRAIASRVLEKAKEMCTAKSVNDVIYEVLEGDARSIICEAVERHQASMLVVGSHGYGAIKRTLLGSVSDYCAHHAHCSVMIVKKQSKIKD